MNQILLLEDEENLNRGISLKLEKEGYQVFSAYGVEQGNSENKPGTFHLFNGA